MWALPYLNELKLWLSAAKGDLKTNKTLAGKSMAAIALLEIKKTLNNTSNIWLWENRLKALQQLKAIFNYVEITNSSQIKELITEETIKETIDMLENNFPPADDVEDKDVTAKKEELVKFNQSISSIKKRLGIPLKRPVTLENIPEILAKDPWAVFMRNEKPSTERLDMIQGKFTELKGSLQAEVVLGILGRIELSFAAARADHETPTVKTAKTEFDKKMNAELNTFKATIDNLLTKYLPTNDIDTIRKLKTQLNTGKSHFDKYILAKDKTWIAECLVKINARIKELTIVDTTESDLGQKEIESIKQDIELRINSLTVKMDGLGILNEVKIRCEELQNQNLNEEDAKWVKKTLETIAEELRKNAVAQTIANNWFGKL